MKRFQVWVNGQLAGSLICSPYELNITDLVHTGVNSLQIEVTNTLVHACQDMMSLTSALEPSGLLGPVKSNTNIYISNLFVVEPVKRRLIVAGLAVGTGIKPDIGTHKAGDRFRIDDPAVIF